MPDDELKERHIARLLVALYYCGTSVSSLLEGDTRQIESLLRLQRFDFWLREPGHLALALLHAYKLTPASFADAISALRDGLVNMVTNRQIDMRRVYLGGSGTKVYADLDPMLAFLTSCVLVADRPSFSKNQPTHHQIILETQGIRVAEQIMAECPSFGWYKAQGDVIRRFFPILEQADLTTMPYLRPDLTASTAAVTELTAIVTGRAITAFPDLAASLSPINDPSGDVTHAHV